MKPYLLVFTASIFALSALSAFAKVDPTAMTQIKDASGKTIGEASFVQTPQGVKVAIEVSGLSPGNHGVHFHETGKCEGPGFKTAGGHINPAHTEHGLDNPKGPHAGDLPNLVVGADGKGKASFTTNRVTLGDGDNSLLKAGGTSLVVHAQADDEKTSPAGNSGDRVACGVIAATK